MNKTPLHLRIQQTLGPGLIFAAVSIGVSHLVQSTRAGALYGLSMLGIIVLAHVMKYPAFRFGPEYTAITGKTILFGFKRQGTWALVLFAFLSIPHMFGGTAAVTLVTAGLFKTVLGLDMDIKTIVLIMLVGCPIILIIGRYHLLDRIIKILMVVLVLSTIATTVIVVPNINWGNSVTFYPSTIDFKMILFMVALFGWMPSPMDTTVWHSLWAKAKMSDSDGHFDQKGSRLDFHVGYIGTVILAICFMFLGFAVMYKSGASFSNNAAEFAAQFIGLYTKSLGDWSAPIIKISALAVMFSTTLVIVDAYPRAIAALSQQFDTDIQLEEQIHDSKARRWYIGSMLVLSIGVLMIVYLFTGTFKTLVDFATTFSFLSAPIIAWLVHRSIMSDDIPINQRPPVWLLRYSALCVTGLSLFALGYIYILIRY